MSASSSASTEDEEGLFQQAVRAFEAGDLAAARRGFKAVVALAGPRRAAAKEYLERIELREREEELFAEARELFDDGRYGPARDLLETVVRMGSARAEEAAKLLRRVEAELGGGPSRGAEVDGGFESGTRDGGAVFSAPPDFESVRSPARGLPPDHGVREAAVAPPAPGAPDPVEPLRRTPHMDVAPEGPFAAGRAFYVVVYADERAARSGETVNEVVIKAAASVRSFDLQVFLAVSDHFRVEGGDTASLLLERDRPSSDPVAFKVRVVDDPAQAAGTPEVTAYFTYRGRPCGMVCREVPVEGLAAAAPAPAAAVDAAEPAEDVAADLPPRRDALDVEVGALAADLTLDIIQTGAKDGRTFTVTVRTPVLSDYAEGKSETWALSTATKDLVADYMARFTSGEIDNEDRLLELEGAGIELFEASPDLFQKVFWKLIESKIPFETIAIVSEEPYVPWELMVPTRTKAGRREQRQPLGVEFRVSRWSAGDHTSPPQKIPLTNSVVVAPRDSGLVNAESEAAMVLAGFPGQRIDPAAIKDLDEWLGKQNTTLLHFICHGESGTRQVLKLEGGKVLNTSQLRALDGLGRAVAEGRPLIFLNACQVGRPVPALVGPGGFAEAFMRMGAAGVVAPLWSVRDSIAHEIAVEFYKRIKEKPETPFAEIMRDIRKKAYEEGGGEDTYAAYCFYGDPYATAG